MPNKTAILDNVEQYTTDELVRYIKDGIVTFDELCDETDGSFAASIRKEVMQKLSASEAADWTNAKNSGDVDKLKTYIKVYPNGKHKVEAQQLILDLEKRKDLNQAAEKAWQTVDKQSTSALQNFMVKYPNTPHCADANAIISKQNGNIKKGEALADLVEYIEQVAAGERTTDRDKNPILNAYAAIFTAINNDVNNHKIESSDITEIIKKDHNIFDVSFTTKLIANNLLNDKDLKATGIDKGFVKLLSQGVEPKNFNAPKAPTGITKQSTEVYFWGIPSSGKSCALGAILSTANTGHVAKTMSMDNECQGYDYMNRLAELFKKGKIGVLPGTTPIASTYEMGFDLVANDGKKHPLTFIDLAGELFLCMYKEKADKKALDQNQITALGNLQTILCNKRTKNQKIHFFVIEYGAEERKYQGLTQKTYLNAAVEYIKKMNIFKDNTDAIYILITKADKARKEQEELEDTLCKYIKDNYHGFYNELEEICKENEINEGKVEIIPFSLGEVCFQNYCKFSDNSAKEVVEILLNRSKGYSNNGKFNRLIGILRK